MSKDKPLIKSTTKVADLLKSYPELEDVLIAMAPPFKKLKNPFLRKSVAKLASLQQAAAVAHIPINQMLNDLRAAVGQAPLEAVEQGEEADYFGRQPEWFDKAHVVMSLNEREIEADKMPINRVLKEGARLKDREILELVTAFLPAPGIDVMKSKGFVVWAVQEAPELVKT
ncbi:MAG: DUF1858 domain-containing protein, partial [Candidatus Latescibacterota bacterium]